MVLGPVRNTPISQKNVISIARGIDPSGEHIDIITRGLNECPKMSLYFLIPLLVNVYRMINFGQSENDHFNQTISFSKVTFFNDLPDETVLRLESLEEIFEHLIQSGNVLAMKEWLSQNSINSVYTEYTRDPLRDAKNNFIILITLAARAAAHGGLDRMITMEKEMNYLLLLEKLSTAEEILSLQKRMALEYTESVRQLNAVPLRSKITKNAIQYIQRHISKKINISDIASDLSLSRGYLSSTFRAETGQTLSGYIQKAKINEAKRLLKDSSMSLASISHDLGFSSQAYFSRVFKKITGQTPKEFRNDPGTTSQ